MLPKRQRIARSAEIQAVIRQGISVKTGTAIAHVWVRPGSGARFGYIAGKRIGNAVTRNYAKRRFRELTRPLLAEALTAEDVAAKSGAPTEAIDIIWRLHPASATASVETIQRDIAKVWRKATHK